MRARVLYLAPVLGIWAALLALLGYVASLPRAATPLGPPDRPHGQLLAYTDDTVYLLVNEYRELVVESLPTLHVRARLQLGERPTSVAWDGKRLLIATGESRNGWALLQGDKWVVPPTWQGPDARVSAFRDSRTGSLVLASLGKSKYENETSKHTFRALSLRTVGRDGRLGDATTLRVATIPAVQTICGSRHGLYAASILPGSLCRIADVDHDGMRSCTPVPGAKLQCPNVVSLGAPSELVVGETRRRFVIPPKGLVADSMPAQYFFRLLPKGVVTPQARWFSRRYGIVAPLSTGFLSAGRDKQTRENGRLGRNKPEHMELRLWDAHGQATGASRKVFGEGSPPDLLLARGDELDVFVRAGIARFRASDLQRLDAQDAIWAVRERLAPWGGRSWLFEGLLGAVLVFGPLLSAVLAFVHRPGRWRVWATAAYLLPALVVLYWTARRIWWF